MWFHDRKDAGKKLALRLDKFREVQPVVLAVPRGGVIVGAEVANKLNAPLDILIVRKIGAPFNPEVAIGAVMPDGTAVLDEEIIAKIKIPEQYIEQEIAQQTEEIQRRQHVYKGEESMPVLAGKTVILVDDGIATGYTIEAAALGLRNYNPRSIIIAVPVAPAEVIERMSKVADEVICLDIPDMFMSVGQFYLEFPQNTDKEVIDALQAAKKTYTY